MGGYDQSRLHAGSEQLSSRQGEKQMNSDRLNESLEALFREIKRVQAAKRAAPGQRKALWWTVGWWTLGTGIKTCIVKVKSK